MRRITRKNIVMQEVFEMLFILFGATLEMGYQCREIFKELGFGIIQKYNYVSDSAKVSKKLYMDSNRDEFFARWYNDKMYADTLEEIEQCDFRYVMNSIHVGFNKEQILEAVHGASDSLLTIGTATLDFVMQLKKAYGAYVTLINIFSDANTVHHDNRLSSGISRTESEMRDAANQNMQRVFLNNIVDFDETVIFTGNDSVFDLAALKQQFITIIDKRRLIEKELNNRNYVELPYKGDRDYLFISYSHLDKEQVYTDLLYLQRHSYRIWYDDGIVGGDNWRKIISDKIAGCSQFLLFVSKDSCVSYDVQAEINLALDLHKKVLLVALDGSILPDEYRMYLMNVNQIRYGAENYYQKLQEALLSSLQETGQTDINS